MSPALISTNAFFFDFAHVSYGTSRDSWGKSENISCFVIIRLILMTFVVHQMMTLQGEIR